MNDVATNPAVTPALPKGPRKAAVLFIFATALMDVISLGIMIPVLPNLVKQFAGGDTALAAQYTIAFAVTWGLMQFFFGPIVGMLSDRFGRRPVLLTGLACYALAALGCALATGIPMLVICRALQGFSMEIGRAHV